MRPARVLALLCAFASTAAFAALPNGAKAPDFTAQASLAGKPFTFSLAEALKQGPVVLYFYPAAFTSGCTIYVIAPTGEIVYSYNSLNPDKHVANTMAAVKKWAGEHRRVDYSSAVKLRLTRQPRWPDGTATETCASEWWLFQNAT